MVTVASGLSLAVIVIVVVPNAGSVIQSLPLMMVALHTVSSATTTSNSLVESAGVTVKL